MTSSDWTQDRELGAGFVCKTLFFGDDYDGKVTATLVRNEPFVDTYKPAILYIHGYIDYFLQKHVAHRFNAATHNFYGLDLRKYGRSLMPHQRPNICLTFKEYFPEITKSLQIIADEGHTSVVLMAHSTGALPGALYAKEGSDERKLIKRIIFNSPFLKIPNAGAGLLAACGEKFPFRETDNRINKWYVRSLHKSDKGEWDFNLKIKPFDGFRAYWGWVRAVYLLQERIKDGGLRLEQPVLVMHSDKSLNDKEWSEKLHRADLVLKVKDIKERGPLLGPPGRVAMREIRDGKHDLTLSVKEPRTECLDAMVEWAGKT